MSIAWACEVEALGADLSQIALDPSSEPSLRSSAAAAAAKVGTREVRAGLRPLVLGQTGDDPTDELKGSGLRAMWPDLLTASEMFDLLTIPKQRHMSTSYSSFLYGAVCEHLRIEDIPTALAWFAKQGHRHNLVGPIGALMDGIIRLAWTNLHEPGVSAALSQAILSRLELHDHGLLYSDDERAFAGEIQRDEPRRRTFLRSILPLLQRKHLATIITFPMDFLVPSDVGWLVDQILTADEASAPILAELVCLTFDGGDRETAAKLWSACQSNRHLSAKCLGLFGPVDLDSEQAKILREAFIERKKWATPKILVPSPSDRIETTLRAFEAGNVSSWVQLILDLTLEPTSTHYELAASPDPRDTPGWRAADASTRGRILSAATQYLLHGDPQNSEWFRTTAIPYAAIGGYRALALLMAEEAREYSDLPREVWSKWIPVLLRFGFGEKDEAAIRERLLRRAHEVFPEETTRWITEVINSENEANRTLFLTNEMNICWDEALGRALLEKSRSRELKPQVLGGLLEFLLRRDFAGSRETAVSRLEDIQFRDSAFVAGRLLLRYTPDASWPVVWPIIKANEEIGRGIVESASYGSTGETDFVSRLDEQQLGDFYLWMVNRYPYTDRTLGFSVVGPEDSAVMLRDAILLNLKGRGSVAACDALSRAMAALPQYPWLCAHLEDAEALARAACWRPVSISEFLAMVLNKDKRFVDSGDQLVDVILESLDRLRAKLHGELPAIRDLWNTSKIDFSPKDEQEIADYINRHLDSDLSGRSIIVNREVQIRRGIGDGTGQRTDIHVDTFVQGNSPERVERIYAIIEVKGNWNEELGSAMNTQLRDRYLRENRCKEGLYLVAWFASPKWSDSDSRKSRCPKFTLTEAQDRFSKQAGDLSTDGFMIRSYILDSSLS